MKKTKEEKYNLFKEKIIGTVKQFYGDDYDITVNPVQKNNGLVLYGLNILKRDTYVCPTIYLEDFFERYEGGCAFSTIFREIVEIYERYKEPDFLDLDFFSDYEKVREVLSIKLINAEYNKEMLEDVPYRRIEDLAIVCIAEIVSPDNHLGSVLIHNNHICMWGIRAQELIDEAIHNAMKNQDVMFEKLSDVIMELYDRTCENDLGDEDECVLREEMSGSEDYGHGLLGSEDFGLGSPGSDNSNLCLSGVDGWSGENEQPTMYVLSNSRQMFGAAVMAFPGILEAIGKRLGCNYYIIPSSIHELIILPDNISGQVSNLNEMISSINSEMLSKEEVLSNHAYLYDISSKAVLSVKEEQMANS